MAEQSVGVGEYGSAGFHKNRLSINPKLQPSNICIVTPMARSKKSKPQPPIPASAQDERWLRFYRQMVKIRLFEEEVNQLYLGAKMPGLAHLYIGEEAIAVGVCEALRQDDYITSTHRGHGHCIAKGASIDRMFAELLGKEAGYCRGKGGSMHIADQDTGNLGANAIVGGSAGIATGAAMSIKMRGTNQVAVCFFGDGALGQGLLYETMNMASLWKLPVIYVCENNQYNEYTHYRETTAGDVIGRAKAFGIQRRIAGRPGCARGPYRGAESGRASAPRRWPSFFGMSIPTGSTVTMSATSTGLLPLESRRTRVEIKTRSGAAARGVA